MAAIETYGFAAMRGEVRTLRSKLEDAIAADRREASTYLLDLNLGAASTWPSDFTSRANALVDSANTAMAGVESLCDGELRKNAPVPRRLEEDAEAWRSRSGAVRDKVLECAKQRNIPDWSGDAKDAYVTAVLVQEAALEELQGVMDSTAQGCDAGAVLNRAIFYAVGQAVIGATSAVRTGSGGFGSSYYLRTAHAIPVLEALVGQIERACSGEVVDGSASLLASEMRATVSMPKVLSEGRWPTGTSAAGIEPAATDKGVISDGSDADVDVEAQINQCLAGVNR